MWKKKKSLFHNLVQVLDLFFNNYLNFFKITKNLVIVNFRIYKINWDAYKLTRTFILIKNIISYIFTSKIRTEMVTNKTSG